MGNPMDMIGRMMFGGGGSGASAGAPREDRIRILADSHSNKLLIRANPLDMHSVMKLIAKIDQNDTRNKIVIKTHWVRLNMAHATEVSEIIDKVYRENMSQQTRTAVQNVSPFGAFAAAQRGPAPLRQDSMPTAIPPGSCCRCPPSTAPTLW